MANAPWFRRSPLWQHEAEIRRLCAEGFSARQIVERLELSVTPHYLANFLTTHGWRKRRRRSKTGADPIAPPPQGGDRSMPSTAPAPTPSPVVAAPAETDYAALLQSQFKRPIR